jgi:acyl dehydratase
MIGEELMPLERRLDQVRMVAYAGATWDWHRLHHDAAFAEEMKLPAPVVDGQMLGALMAEQIQDHFGPHAFIARLSIRYRTMVFAGQTVRSHGEVSGGGGGVVTVELTMRADDKIAATGRAEVRIDEDDEEE